MQDTEDLVIAGSNGYKAKRKAKRPTTAHCRKIIDKPKSLELEAQRVLIWDYSKLPYGFLNSRVRYAIESATARYPIMAIKLAIVEAMNG